MSAGVPVPCSMVSLSLPAFMPSAGVMSHQNSQSTQRRAPKAQAPRQAERRRDAETQRRRDAETQRRGDEEGMRRERCAGKAPPSRHSSHVGRAAEGRGRVSGERAWEERKEMRCQREPLTSPTRCLSCSPALLHRAVHPKKESILGRHDGKEELPTV
jgi:hypothetical protein